MDTSTLVASLQNALPGVELSAAPTIDIQPTIYAPREHVEAIARVLRDDPACRFDVLIELTAVDRRPYEPLFEVVYLLLSLEHRQRLRLKIRVPLEDPVIATVSGVWAVANWLEREVWDLFGIAFAGHPDLRRLLMPDDWEGHPLRKDYPVQIRKTPQVSEPLQVTQSEFEASIARDRMVRHEP
jgi:NADH-quinone oxidoreductase subunit C